MNLDNQEFTYDDVTLIDKMLPMTLEPSGATKDIGRKHVCNFDINEWNLENNIKYERMPHKSNNNLRLSTALKLLGNKHLEFKTLLDPEVYKKHSRNFYLKLLRKFQKSLIPKKKSIAIQKKYNLNGPIPNGSFGSNRDESVNHENAREHVRFITVIHEVKTLDVDAALLSAKNLKQQIKEYVSKIPGAACTGAIEIELISIKEVRRIREFFRNRANKVKSTDADGVITFYRDVDQSDFRKLDSCVILASDISEADINGESGQFLIHMHGFLKVENPKDFDTLNKLFLTNPIWSRSQRQVLFKKLDTKDVHGHFKSIETNLRYLSSYMTKCGAVIKGVKPFLQYNIPFPKDIGMSYDDYLKHSDQVVKDKKRQAKINNFELLDMPNYSHHEINSLAMVYYGMMNWNKLGTGYIVDIGKW